MAGTNSFRVKVRDVNQSSGSEEGKINVQANLEPVEDSGKGLFEGATLPFQTLQLQNVTPPAQIWPNQEFDVTFKEVVSS